MSSRSHERARRARHIATSATVLCVAALQACTAPVESDPAPKVEYLFPDRSDYGEPMDEAFVRDLLPENWLGYEVGLPLPRVYDLGAYDVPFEDQPVVRPRLAPDAEAAHEEPSGEPDYGMLVFVRGRKYLIDFPVSEEFTRRFEERQSQQLDEAVAGVDPAVLNPEMEEEIEGLGISRQAIPIDGEDRVRLGLADGVSKDSWLAAIGALVDSSGNLQGTGTLIGMTGDMKAGETEDHRGMGSRVVMTAAHVFVGRTAMGDAFPRTLTFTPRANGSMAPWGTWMRDTAVAGALPFQYEMIGCHNNYTVDCIQWDWAALTFTRSGAGNFKLFMKVKEMPQAELSSIKNRGYPDCESDFAPDEEDCQPRTLYGDPEFCSLSGFQGNENGLRFRARHNCDTSDGHSGSPLYKYVGQRPTIAGIHVSDCGFGDCGMATNGLNRARMITRPVRDRVFMAMTMGNPP